MKISWVSVVLGLVLLCASGTGATQMVDRIVAVVNGEIITYQELVHTIRAFSGEAPDPSLMERIADEVLDSMIDDVVLRQEAERLQVTVSDSEIENEIKQFKTRRRLDDEDFQRSLRLQGLTLEEFKEHTRQEIIRQQILAYMVRRKVVVTQEEIDAYIAHNRPELVSERVVDLQLLILADERGAQDIQKQLRAGDLTFADAVAKYSIGSKEDDGLMTGVRWRELDEPWRVVLRDLNPGDLSPAFMVQDKWVVLKLVNESQGESRTVTSVEDEVREAILRPKLEERFKEYMAGLRTKALIDKRL